MVVLEDLVDQVLEDPRGAAPLHACTLPRPGGSLAHMLREEITAA